MSHLLVMAMARLDEERVLRVVEAGLARGQSPTEILALTREGLERVGREYGDGRLFLADLLMAAEIFRRVLDLLTDVAPVKPDLRLPPIVFGTVEGDIHEIGKNVTIAFMRYNGLRIVDLGGNVSPQQFVEAVRTHSSTRRLPVGAAEHLLRLHAPHDSPARDGGVALLHGGGHRRARE